MKVNLVTLIIFLSFCTFGCTEQKTNNSTDLNQTSTHALSPNGGWILTDYTNLQTTGDHIYFVGMEHLGLNQTQESSIYFKFGKTNSNDYVGGMVVKSQNPQNPFHTDYDVLSLVFDDGINTYSVEPNQSQATITFQNNQFNNVSGYIQGVNLVKTSPQGEYTIIPSFELSFDVELASPEPTEDQPIPQDEEFACPNWAFYDQLGEAITLPARRSPDNIHGLIAKSAFDQTNPGGMVIKLESGDLNTNPLRGAEIAIDGIPTQGFTGPWPTPVRVTTVRKDEYISWTAPTMSASLEVIDWKNGMMIAKIIEPNGTYSDVTNSLRPYIERNVGMNLLFRVPLPQYSRAYYESCSLPNNNDQKDCLKKCDEQRKEDEKKCNKKGVIDEDCMDDAALEHWECTSKCRRDYPN